jgi:DNA polymerase-1
MEGEHEEHLVYDIETDGLFHEVTTIWCIGIMPAGGGEVITYTDYDPARPSLREGLDRLKAAQKLIGHNVIGYDMPVVNKLCPGDELTFEQQWDTMVVAALLEPSRRSVALASYGQQFGFPKGDYSDWTGGYTDEMRVYMERDVELNQKLYVWLQAELNKLYRKGYDYREAVKLEHQVQHCLSLQSNHGFRFDVEAAESLSVTLSRKLDDIVSTLELLFTPRVRPSKGRWCFKQRAWTNPEIFTPKIDNKRSFYTKGAGFTKCHIEPFNPGSREQVAVRLNQRYGWKPTEFTADGKPKLDEATLADLDYEAADILRKYFRLTKQLGMLSEGRAAWLKLHKDGRMHGYVRSCGARTHRMSHRGPNMAQVDKDKAMRSLFLPDHDHVLVGCDADALELRMLAAYLHRYDQGAYGNAVLHGTKEKGTDPHTLNMKAAGLSSRNNAKTFFYGLIYGAGDAKLGSIVFDDLVAAGKETPPKSRIPALGKIARKNIEDGVKGLGRLIQDIGKQAERNKCIQLPDGRTADSGVRTGLNTCLQGAGSILMKKALAIFYFDLASSEGLVHGRDYAFVANVHDEAQMTCAPEHADTVGGLFALAINMAGKQLNLPVAFGGDYQIGANWSETH